MTFQDCVRVAEMVGILACVAPTASGDDAAEIQALFPEATAMSSSDFESVLKNPDVPPTLERFQDQNLTLHVLTMEHTVDEDVGKDFSFFENRPPHPRRFAEEIGRGNWLLGGFIAAQPVTAIHADRIQGMTCVVAGDRATGEVSFESPDLFKGRFEYVATRVNGKWKIAELAIPSRNVGIVRGDDGLWTRR